MKKDLYENRIDSYKTAMDFNKIIKKEMSRLEIDKVNISGPYIYVEYEGEKYGKYIHFMDYLIQEYEYEMNVSMWEFFVYSLDENDKYWSKFKADFIGQVAEEYTADFINFIDDDDYDGDLEKSDIENNPMDFTFAEFDHVGEVVRSYNEEMYESMFDEFVEKHMYEYTLEHFRDFLRYLDDIKHEYLKFKEAYKYWEDK